MVQSNLKGKAVSIGYTGFVEVKNQQIKKKRKKQRKMNERKEGKKKPSLLGLGLGTKKAQDNDHSGSECH